MTKDCGVRAGAGDDSQDKDRRKRAVDSESGLRDQLNGGFQKERTAWRDFKDTQVTGKALGTSK